MYFVKAGCARGSMFESVEAAKADASLQLQTWRVGVLRLVSVEGGKRETTEIYVHGTSAKVDGKVYPGGWSKYLGKA